MKTIDIYKAVFDSAPDGLIVANDLGEIVLANHQIEKLLGYTHFELVGQKIEFIIPKRYHEKHTVHSGDYKKNPSAREMGAKKELWALKKDGTELPVEISLSPIRLQDRVLISAAIRDVSDKIRINLELEKQNKKLIQQNKELEQFTYLCSHDLQEPLQSLVSFSSFLKEEYGGNLGELGNKYIDFISNSSARLHELVRGLMHYSLIGKVRELKKIDCNDLLNEVMINFKSSIDECKVIISTQKLPTITCYPSEIRRLFTNLIDNAIKFKKKDGVIEINITAVQNNDTSIFSIEDNGIGIDEQNKDIIFSLFKRLHNRNEYEGIGIGLAQCKKIVDIHGGDISVESSFGIGTTINFSIPNL